MVLLKFFGACAVLYFLLRTWWTICLVVVFPTEPVMAMTLKSCVFR